MNISLARLDDEDDGIDRSTWCTPRALCKRLGEWDLDPCSNARSHVRARRTFDLERGQDGLRLAKFVSRSTRAFINPPYSRGQVERWVDAYAHANFCFLIRFDPSTAWFERLFARSELVCVLRDRIEFEPPPGVETSSNPYPHALCYRRAVDATPAVLVASFVMTPAHAIIAGNGEAKRSEAS